MPSGWRDSSGKPRHSPRSTTPTSPTCTASRTLTAVVRWSRWNGNGEICYRGGPKMMGVKFDGAGPQPVIGNPQPLFADEYDYGQGLSIANYDVTREGRFIMLRRAYDGNTLRLAVDWTEALQRMVAAGGAK